MRTPTAAAVVLGLIVLGLTTATARGQGYVCAEGGGGFGRGTWAVPVVAWMVEQGKKGQVVILGAAAEGATDDEPAEPVDGAKEPPVDPLVERFREAGAAGITDIRIDAKGERNLAAAKAINEASIVFIRGGSQTRYVNDWKGTPVEAALRALFARGGVIGGSSAGCAVLGEVIYDAQKGSLGPKEILQDGRHAKLTLATGFLELTPGVIFDTHFTERGRLPRLAVMLAKAKTDLKRDGKPDLLGIGCDTRTALCISPDGRAEVMGEGSVTFLSLSKSSTIALPPNHPPAVTDVRYDQLIAGTVYDLKSRQVVSRPDQVRLVADEDRIAIPAPILQPGRVRGGVGDDSDAGALVVMDRDEPDALVNGEIKAIRGMERWAYSIVQTRTFDDRGRVQNRIGGVQWLLVEHPGWLAVWLTEGLDAKVNDRGRVVCLRPEPEPADDTKAEPKAVKSASMMVLDTSGVRAIGQSLAMHGPDSEGPRQSVAIEGAVFHLLSPSWGYRPRQPVDPDPPAALHPTEVNK